LVQRFKSGETRLRAEGHSSSMRLSRRATSSLHRIGTSPSSAMPS
jgi:hypothetical protein